MNNISTGNDTSCYTNLSPGLSLQMYSNIADHHDRDQDHDQVNNNNNINTVASPTNSLLYGLSILKDKVHQLQTLAAILLSPAVGQPDSSSPAPSAAIMNNMHNAIQEIIMTASSMLLTFQHHMGLVASASGNYNSAMTNIHNSNNDSPSHHQNIGNAVVSSRSQLGQALSTYPSSTSNGHQTVLDWPYVHDQTYINSTITATCSMIKDKNKYNNNNNMIMAHYSTTSSTKDHDDHRYMNKGSGSGMADNMFSPKSTSNYDIVELDATDLLAKYTHYCHVCGKGFKRDANLRMHMRAHGDEYKTSAALSNPMKKMINNNGDDLMGNFGSSGGDLSGNRALLRPKKYSCPQEGCRWNQRHAKFQPLKSMICVKNHYKRSHCPKMYVCKRCNRKQFSVLSDLRTHEKHCGDLKWQCSCGTTFSRKDKLMGHVTLFVGHAPVILNSVSNTNIKIAKVESQILSQSQIDSIVKMIE